MIANKKSKPVSNKLLCANNQVMLQKGQTYKATSNFWRQSQTQSSVRDWVLPHTEQVKMASQLAHLLYYHDNMMELKFVA